MCGIVYYYILVDYMSIYVCVDRYITTYKLTTLTIRYKLYVSISNCFVSVGEEKFSYGYGGTAKFSTNCKFEDFGEKFGEGDVITTYLVSEN